MGSNPSVAMMSGRPTWLIVLGSRVNLMLGLSKCWTVVCWRKVLRWGSSESSGVADGLDRVSLMFWMYWSQCVWNDIEIDLSCALYGICELRSRYCFWIVFCQNRGIHWRRGRHWSKRFFQCFQCFQCFPWFRRQMIPPLRWPLFLPRFQRFPCFPWFRQHTVRIAENTEDAEDAEIRGFLWGVYVYSCIRVYAYPPFAPLGLSKGGMTVAIHLSHRWCWICRDSESASTEDRRGDLAYTRDPLPSACSAFSVFSAIQTIELSASRNSLNPRNPLK